MMAASAAMLWREGFRERSEAARHVRVMRK